MVKPSTLPVAGRAGTVVADVPTGLVVADAAVVVGAGEVVVAAVPELEHPATTGRARASSAAAANGVVRESCIGSS
jgi:hypothetical protein